MSKNSSDDWFRQVTNVGPEKKLKFFLLQRVNRFYFFHFVGRLRKEIVEDDEAIVDVYVDVSKDVQRIHPVFLRSVSMIKVSITEMMIGSKNWSVLRLTQ